MNRMAAAVVIVLTALSLGTARAAVAHAGAATAAVKPSQEAVSPSEALERVASEQLSQLDTGDIERFLRQIDDDVAQRLPKFDIKHIMSTHGTDLMDLPWIGRELIGYLIHELQLNLRLLGELVVVAVVCTLLCLLGAGLGEDGPAAVAWAVGYMVMVVLGVRSFCVTAEIATRAVEQMTSFMYAVIPALMGTLAATGGVVTAAVVSPFMMGATAAVGTLVKTTVVPLLLMAVTLSLVGEISQRKQLSRLAGLLKWAGMTVMGLAATVFVALAGMRGGLASVSDGAAAKAVSSCQATWCRWSARSSVTRWTWWTSSLLVRGRWGVWPGDAGRRLSLSCDEDDRHHAGVQNRGCGHQPLGDSRVSDCRTNWEVRFVAVCMRGYCRADVFIGVSIVVGLGGVVVAVR